MFKYAFVLSQEKWTHEVISFLIKHKMSSATNDMTTLDLIINSFSISTNLSVFMLGIVGNILNIIVFASLKIFRKNPCAFCLLILSISDSGMLFFSIVPNFFTDVFKEYNGIVSIFSCKISIPLAQTFGLISHCILCLASIDQYLSTSMHEHRKGVSLHLTRRLIIIFIFVCTLHGIPFVIHYDAQTTPGTNVTTCRLNDNGGPFSKYLMYVGFPIIAGFLPISIMSIFALIALRNVRTMSKRRVHIIRLRLEQQLTAMVLMKIFVVCITVIPFIISYILRYTMSFYSTDIMVQEKCLLINRIGSFLLIINYAVSIIFSRFIKYYFCFFRIVFTFFLHLLLVFDDNLNLFYSMFI